MPKFTKPTPKSGADRLLPDALKRRSERPRFDPRSLPPEKGARAGKVRGGRPPRFPGRTGGR
ncbi:MAG: hypothetical protein AAFY97_06210 [Pseudomonadota bacterium]